jgi:putative endonuclease
MVECADKTYYTGWTNDLANRLAAHNAGTGARYTRGRGPVRLVYTEECDNKQSAQRREWAIKKLTRAQKEQLVSNYTGQ